MEKGLNGKTLEDIITDSQGRIIIKCEGGSTTKVYTFLRDVEGNIKMRYYQNGYKFNGTVPLSKNGLAPNFSSNPDWLRNVSNEKNIVRIKMQGGYPKDFKAANEAAGITLVNMNKAPDGYTWHHLDDFDPITGECTFQLVKSDIHTATKPHTGGAAMYDDFNNTSKYK